MRTKKAMRNIITSIINQIVSTICALIAPRLILVTFGSTYNGVVSSISQLLSFISILTLGIAGATRAALYKPLANGDTDIVSRIVKTNKRYMRKVAIVLLVYIVALMIIYPFISHVELEQQEIALLILVVSLSTLAEYLFGTSNRTLLSADQSGYIYYTIDILAKIARTLLIIFFIKNGANVILVYFASSFVFFVAPMIMNFYVNKKYGLDTKCKSDNSLIPQKSAAAFHSIANIVHNNTDVLVLTLFTDAKTISVYSVYYLVVSKIKSILQIFTDGMEGAFGNIWAQKEDSTFKGVFFAYESALFSFAGIAFSCVAVLLIPFIKLYTSGVNDINYVLPFMALLVTITETVFCIREPYKTAVQATGNYEATKIGALIEAIVNIITSVILVQFIGILGVVIGTLLANLIRTSQYAIFTYRIILKIRMSVFLGKIIWLVSNMCMIILISERLNQFMITASGWLGWICQAVITIIISCAFTLVGLRLFYKNEFHRLCRTLLVMLHIKHRG